MLNHKRFDVYFTKYDGYSLLCSMFFPICWEATRTWRPIDITLI